MAKYDSADLLAKTRTEIRRPSGSDFPQDQDVYEWLTRGQDEVIRRIAGIVPESQYGAPTLITSADGGFTFTFGTDTDGNTIVPIGSVEVYRTLTAIPSTPCQPGIDFLLEGDRIRAPNNLPWSGTGPYVRFVTPPYLLSGAVAPILKPVQARECLIYYAASLGWTILDNDANAADENARFEACYLRHLTALRSQFFLQDAVAGLGNYQLWYQNGDFGSGGGPG